MRTMRNTQIYMNLLRISQKRHYVSATKTKTNIYKLTSYLTGNTLRLHYKAQTVNAAY
jgi:hypothetical protein